MTKWEKVVHELSNKFGLKVEQFGPGIAGRYLGYNVICAGHDYVVVYNTRDKRYEQTQDIKYAEKCVEAYIPIIKKWILHFKELALESDFK